MYTESSLEGFCLVHTSLKNGLFATFSQGMYTKTTLDLSYAVHTRYVQYGLSLIWVNIVVKICVRRNLNLDFGHSVVKIATGRLFGGFGGEWRT